MGPAESIAAFMAGGVLIALLCVIGDGFKRWVAYKQRKLEVEAEANRARLAERGDYAEVLEERVRVLERIATDRGQDIAHQIESLRNRQTAEKI
jgi:hypothetical protein